MIPDGDLRNITFVVPGPLLQQIAKSIKIEQLEYTSIRGAKRRSKLWNARRDWSEPRHFTIFNNGSSALCENFEFNRETTRLRIAKFQRLGPSSCRGGGPMTIVPRPLRLAGVRPSSASRPRRRAPVPFRSRPDRRLRRVRLQARGAKRRFGGGGELRHHLDEQARPAPSEEEEGRQPTFPLSEGVTRRRSCPRRRYCPGPNRQPGC
jgi:hypothetical protein